MRCPRLAAILVVLMPLGTLADAEQDRRDMAGRLGAAAVPPPEHNAAAAAAVVEAGRKIWTRKFGNGKTLASCFPNGGRRIAATYPQFDSRLKRVVTFEMALNQCLKANGEPLIEPGESETMGALTAYARSLSDGQKVNVRVPAAAEERFQEGKRLYFTRLGQRNYACASCHVQSAAKRFDGLLLPPATAQGAHWPRVSDGRAVTIQMRMRECLARMGAAPFAFASEELNNLEYFLTYLSNGAPMKANAARPAS
jgi:L-cysteine S-thiosulfotransferase